jgi:photosystem II stability/assembly factor-like uncharacterized protein
MKLRSSVAAAFLLVLSFALPTYACADRNHARVVEAGPEDALLCCNGVIPFLFHGEKVLTTTGRAGIFRSEDRGKRWERSMKNLVAPNGVSGVVGHICQAPSEPRIVYALAGIERGLVPFDGLFSSNDFGESWTRRAAVSTDFGFGTCAVDDRDSRTVYVSAFQAIWKSTDGGKTVQVFPVPECVAVAEFSPATYPRGGILYLDAGPGCRFASEDGGRSFSALAEPPASHSTFNVSPDGRAIFTNTFDESSNFTGTFRSIDRGASYVAVNDLPNASGLAFHPKNPSQIYANDGDLLYVSTDGGLNFRPLPASNDPRFLGGIFEFHVDRNGSVYLATRAGPFRTDDGGRSFHSLLTGFRASAVNDLAFDAEGKLLVSVNNTRGVFRQTNGLAYRAIGDTLPPSPVGDNTGVAVAGSPSDANVILVATGIQGGVFRTEDGGGSWTLASGTPARFANTRMAFATGDRVYLVLPAPPGFQPGLYRSNDAGRSFALLSSLRFGALAVDPNNPDVLYLGTFNAGDGLFKSIDGGQTLQNLGQPGFFSALVVDARDTRVIYAGEQFGQVIRSLDGGRTFAPASTGLVGEGVHGLAQDVRGTLFVWLRGGGLFASHDRAASWHAVDTGEALRRSGVEAGRGSLVADPHRRGRVYLGNAGVIRIDADGDHDD